MPLLPLLKPWVKAGITLNEIEGRIGESSNATRVTTKRAPGYEIGAGFDIPILGGFFNLTPQARRIRQKLEYDVPSPSVPTPGKSRWIITPLTLASGFALPSERCELPRSHRVVNPSSVTFTVSPRPPEQAAIDPASPMLGSEKLCGFPVLIVNEYALPSSSAPVAVSPLSIFPLI